MANRRYTISFLDNDKDMIQFIESKRKETNFSAYIRDLIKKDMNSKYDEDLERIYQYVSNRLKKEGVAQISEVEENTESIIDDMDKDIIFDLF